MCSTLSASTLKRNRPTSSSSPRPIKRRASSPLTKTPSSTSSRTCTRFVLWAATAASRSRRRSQLETAQSSASLSLSPPPSRSQYRYWQGKIAILSNYSPLKVIYGLPNGTKYDRLEAEDRELTWRSLHPHRALTSTRCRYHLPRVREYLYPWYVRAQLRNQLQREFESISSVADKSLISRFTTC